MRFSGKIATFCLFFLLVQKLDAQEIDAKNLMRHLTYLSSDELEGRKTLSKGSKLAQDYIREEFISYGLNSHYTDFNQRFSFFNRRDRKDYNDATNLIGFIPGKESRKIIVITAHYDHLGIGRANAEGDTIFNGADDNASGTSALLAMAEYFAKNKPKHSIMFAALDAEEMGLQGAIALIKDFPFERSQILMNVNMDMIGRNTKGEIYASGTHQNPDLKPILEKASSGSYPKLLFGHDVRGGEQQDWTNSSDHGPFALQNIPHIYFGVEDHPDYHTQNDESAGIESTFFAGSANLILKCILELDSSLLED